MANVQSGILVFLIGATAVWGALEARSLRADLTEVETLLHEVEIQVREGAVAESRVASKRSRSGRRSARDGSGRDGSSLRSRDGSAADGVGSVALEEGTKAWEQMEGAVEQANERIREKKSASWARVLIDAVRSEAEQVVESQGLDAEVVDEVVAIYEGSMDTHRAIKQDLESGEIGFMEAREEFEAVREESEDALAELLGEAGVEALQENLPSNRRGGGH